MDSRILIEISRQVEVQGFLGSLLPNLTSLQVPDDKKYDEAVLVAPSSRILH